MDTPKEHSYETDTSPLSYMFQESIDRLNILTKELEKQKKNLDKETSNTNL